MKKITLLFVVLFAFGIYSCNESQLDSVESAELDAFNKNGNNGKNGDNGNNGNNFDLPFTEPGTFQSIEDEQDYCGEPVECTLWAGQTINTGAVTVSNDNANLYVKVYSEAGFQDVEENIKMWIGLTPPDRRPSSGQFPYKVTEDGDTHIFEIPLSTLPAWNYGECEDVVNSYVIIVHADVITESGSSETAYGNCGPIDHFQPWWGFMEYTVQCCEEEESKLGWLYKLGSDWRNFCFSDTQNNTYGISTQFPYENYGGTYPVYGNVKGCNSDGTPNIDEIEIIGNLTVLLSVDKPSPGLKLQFEAEPGYDIDKYFIYVGWKNPVENGVFDSSLASEIIEIDITNRSSDDTIEVINWAGDRANADVKSNREQYYISAMFEY